MKSLLKDENQRQIIKNIYNIEFAKEDVFFFKLVTFSY